MSCSRRHFMAGMSAGALIMMTGAARANTRSLATTLAPGANLIKGEDGQIRPATGPLPAPDQQAKVMQGALEGSNVNATEELISSIDLQRSFELNMRVVSTAKELDEAGTRLLAMPEG